MKTFNTRLSVALLAICMPLLAQAGVAVIANAGVTAGSLSQEQVAQLFLGRSTELPDGTAVVLFDLPEGDATRVEFAEKILQRNEQQLRNHWIRMIFTGKGQPPRALPGDAEVLQMVISTPGAIGYVDSGLVSPRVKVLFRID